MQASNNFQSPKKSNTNQSQGGAASSQSKHDLRFQIQSITSNHFGAIHMGGGMSLSKSHGSNRLHRKQIVSTLDSPLCHLDWQQERNPQTLSGAQAYLLVTLRSIRICSKCPVAAQEVTQTFLQVKAWVTVILKLTTQQTWTRVKAVEAVSKTVRTSTKAKLNSRIQGTWKMSNCLQHLIASLQLNPSLNNKHMIEDHVSTVTPRTPTAKS